MRHASSSRKALAILTSALWIALGVAASAQERGLADRIRNDDPARYPHKPMYADDPASWKDLDRAGFKITQELTAKLRGLGTGAGGLPGVTIAELSRYGAASIRYRVAAVASHPNIDRVLQKTDRFIPDDGSYGIVTAFVGSNGKRGVAVDVVYYRAKYPDKLEAAQVFFVGPDRRETTAAVEADTALPGLFFVTPEMLTTDAAKNAARIRVTISARAIFDTALDGDLANREGFFEAWETAIAKYQALLPAPAPTPVAAAIGPYAEPSPEDMADALAKNQEITRPIFMTFMFDTIRAKRCGFESMGWFEMTVAPPTGAVRTFRSCLKVKKLGCMPSSRGYICGFQMILGIDGWEDPQDPGKGRFFKDENGWAASGT